MRGGGSTCPDDSSKEMSFTVDIWCNPDSQGQPGSMEQTVDPSEGLLDSDPCNVYVSLEHASGCVYYDLRQILRVTGTAMIFFGVVILICGMRVQKMFLAVIVRFAAFVITCTLFYKIHYFAYFDPSEPPER